MQTRKGRKRKAVGKGVEEGVGEEGSVGSEEREGNGARKEGKFVRE